MVDVSFIVKCLDEHKKHANEMLLHQKAAKNALDKAQKECPHTNIIKERDYCSGGYDYVSSVTITETCALCKKLIKSYNDPNHHGRHG